MKRIELLAPAKNLETAIAAINSGADAIYIGASDFGARVNAKNTLESIEKLVSYAHKFYVKVHVTINTILNNEELLKAVDLIKNLYNIGVDAIIVQDMGLIKTAIEGKLPPIQIHASTQCNNRTLEKVKFFDNMGISRVILARELSVKQIQEICQNTDCEIETFIHGALCVSYSGQCYLSYANGGRSANRGECAQPCRKKYSLVEKDGKVLLSDKYLLSLKDFNGAKSIEKLIAAGVNSFKIEGRLKDKNYVKNVVLYYNNLINKYAQRTSSGKIFTDFTPDINKTFNRSYTDYFLNSREECYNFLTPKSMGEIIGKVTKVNKNFIETDTKEKINAQDGICYNKNGEFTGFLVNKVEGDKIYPNKMPDVKQGDILYRNYDAYFDKKLNTCEFSRKIGVRFTINDDSITAEDEDFNMVTAALPKGEKPKNPDKLRQTYIKQLEKLGDSDFYSLSIDIKSDILPFLPISAINETRRELLQKLTIKRLQNYKRPTQKPISYSKYPDKTVDYRANIYNNEAEKFYQNCECNVSEKALESCTNIRSGVELMRTKHCLRYAAGLCSKETKYNKQLFLIDEKGKQYPLQFDCKNCEMIILNKLI